MTYKSDTMRLPAQLDRRVKLLPCQRRMIPVMYASGLYSGNGLAREWKVSKRVIQFILCPDRQIKNLKDRAGRGGSKQYYDKTENTAAVRNSRRYKHECYKRGEL